MPTLQFSTGASLAAPIDERFARQSHQAASQQFAHAVRACRFFDSLPDMEARAALHGHPVFAPMLPALLYRHTNCKCPKHTASGMRELPPFLVLQQGITLCKWWAARPRTPAEVAGMLHALTAHFVALHAIGHVHGSLRGDLVLFMEDSGEWRLLGLNHAVKSGARDCGVMLSRSKKLGLRSL